MRGCPTKLIGSTLSKALLTVGTGVAISAAIGISASPSIAASFTYNNFGATTGLNLVGSTQQINNSIRLTGTQEWQVGGLWMANQQAIANGFTTTFQFRITDPRQNLWDVNGETGGDGFAFVVQNASPTPSSWGGGALGYAGIANSLAVEFDTWNNSPDGYYDGSQWIGVADPNSNHVSIHSRGTAPNSEYEQYSLGSTTNIPDLTNGSIYTALIDYKPGALQVFLNGNSILNTAVDLNSLLSLNNGSAWLGFTGSTGGSWTNQDLLSWSFQSKVAATNAQSVPEPSTLAGLIGLGMMSGLRLYRRRRA